MTGSHVKKCSPSAGSSVVHSVAPASRSRRTGSIERAVTDTWYWGEKNRVSPSSTPEEQAIEMCYPQYPEIVRAMIARMREKRTLDSLRELVFHLDVLRPERKFVMVFTEGWPLYRPDPNLSRVLDNRIPTRADVPPFRSQRAAIFPGHYVRR